MYRCGIPKENTMRNKLGNIGILLGLAFTVGSVIGADGTTKPGAQATQEMESRRSNGQIYSRDERTSYVETIDRTEVSFRNTSDEARPLYVTNRTYQDPEYRHSNERGTTTTTQAAQSQTNRAPISASYSRTESDETYEGSSESNVDRGTKPSVQRSQETRR